MEFGLKMISKNNTMRICLISSVDMDRPYGSTVRPYYISKNLAEFGCEILHICTKPPEVKDENIKYSLKKYYKNKLWIVRTCRDFFRMYKECKRFTPDVIYAHQLSNATRALPLKYLLRIPLVYDEHGSYVLKKYANKKHILWEKIIAKMANKLITVTSDVKKIFTEKHNIPQKKVKVIEDGVDPNLFRPLEKDNRLKEKVSIANHDKVIVFPCPTSAITIKPANVIALKYFFELIPKIEERVENIKFVITGDGGPKLNPPSHNVIYTGFVQDMVAYLNLGDVCVAPYPQSSICGTSGAKNKVIEYFACGKPVVSTEEGIRGFDDAVPNRDFLLALDSDDFVNKLISLLSDEALSKRIGENARELALKYDWSILSKEVLKILESAIE